MALINCPECGKQVSDSAVMCPNCGFNVKDNVESQKTNITKPTLSNEPRVVDTIPKSHRNNKKVAVIAIICTCVALLLAISIYSYASKIIKYNNAVNYYEMQEWEMAIESFEELESFSDSEELLQKSKLQLASYNYELGCYAYSIGDFATSTYLLYEAKSLNPTLSGIEEQIKLSEFMEKLQGTWNCVEIYIEVDGFTARLKDYDCTSYADWCDITPYKNDKGYYTILVKGEPGYRSWELTYEEGTSKDTWSSDWLGSPSNSDVRGYFWKDE